MISRYLHRATPAHSRRRRDRGWRRCRFAFFGGDPHLRPHASNITSLSVPPSLCGLKAQHVRHIESRTRLSRRRFSWTAESSIDRGTMSGASRRSVWASGADGGRGRCASGPVMAVPHIVMVGAGGPSTSFPPGLTRENAPALRHGAFGLRVETRDYVRGFRFSGS